MLHAIASVPRRALTADDLAGLPIGGPRCEIVDGGLYVAPPPTSAHQRAVRALRAVLADAVPPHLVVLDDGAGIHLRRAPRETQFLVPDVLVARRGAPPADRRQVEPADVVLAVEVVAPTSWTHDLVTKRSLYAALGIGSYWVVDLSGEPCVRLLALEAEGYVERSSVAGDQTLGVVTPFAAQVRPADLVDPGADADAARHGARDPLDEAALRRALVRPGLPWSALHVVVETGSTNADLLAAARAGAAEGLVEIAELQVGGRGRQGRSWVSPARAGLTFSVLLRPVGIPPARRGWLPLVAGLALARAVSGAADIDAVVKWPNDVLIGPDLRKVAGLLAQATGDAVVLGIGLNVTTHRGELPVPEATSLALEGAVCTDRATLLVAVLRQLAADYTALQRGVDPRPGYVAACTTLGRMVQIGQPGGRLLEGQAIDVDGAGRLVVRRADGTRAALAVGDVTHVRSAG